MDATFDNQPPDEPAGATGDIDAYQLERVGDGRRTTLALRSTAGAHPDRYEVEADVPGAAVGQRPGAGVVAYFDGPLSPARLAAARFAYRERIAPALATVPGLIRTLVLWHPVAAATCVIHLTVDMAALDAVGHAVNGTELLPDEDPALLTGPDRVEVHRVLAPAATEGARA